MNELAVLWGRFGPYHLARLRGASVEGKRRGFRVLGIEVAQLDHYAWAPVGDERCAEGGAKETLFPGQAYESIRRSMIRREVVAILDRIQPSVVAVNGWSMPEARAALGWVERNRSARAVIMSETKMDEAPRVFWKEWLKRRIVGKAHAGLVGGKKQLEYLVNLGLPEDRIRLGYNAVDNAYFEVQSGRVRSEAARHREELGLPEHYFFVCTRFLPRKNLDGLLRAYAIYQQEMGGQDSWALVISGSGQCEDSLRSRVQALGLDQAVPFVGFRQYDELPVFYGLASAFIHPATSEAWGLVVNEAGAAGLPLLVSRTVGAAYELVEHGVNGFTFDPSDIKDMARAMTRMSQMPEDDRRKMGAAARDRVADYGPQRFGQGLCEAAEAALALKR